MSFGGGGQAVGQGGRPSGTSKVQHFPSTTDSEFRRKASRQTRGKKNYRLAMGMLARIAWICNEAEAVWAASAFRMAFDAAHFLLSACPGRLRRWLIPATPLCSHHSMLFSSLLRLSRLYLCRYLSLLFFPRALFTISISPFIPFSMLKLPGPLNFKPQATGLGVGMGILH